ncbi:MAG: 50S ribosomal protein L25 [bacterium]
MLSLNAKIRKEIGKKVKSLRKEGLVPGVLYGPKIDNLSLEVDLKEFEKVYQAAGESSLITLAIAKGEKKSFLVLIHAVEFDAISQKPIHVDFYQPRLDEEITVDIALVFEGESQAVKDLGGTLVRNIQEIEVRALPQNLPHEIKVSIEKLKTFEDAVLIKDLIVSKEVKILKEPEEVIALVLPPEKIEEELEKPVEEKVEEVEKAEEKKEKKEEEEESQ